MSAILSAANLAVAAVRSPKAAQTAVKVGKYAVKFTATCTAVVVVEETVRRAGYRAADGISNFSARRRARRSGHPSYSKEHTHVQAPRRIQSKVRFVVDAGKYTLASMGLVGTLPVYLVIRPVSLVSQFLLGMPVRWLAHTKHDSLTLGAAMVFSTLTYPLRTVDDGVCTLLWGCYRVLSDWYLQYGPKASVERHPVRVGDDTEVEPEPEIWTRDTTYETYFGKPEEDEQVNLDQVNDLVRDITEARSWAESHPAKEEEESLERPVAVAKAAILEAQETAERLVEIDLKIDVAAIRRDARAEGRRVANKLREQDEALVGECRKVLRDLLSEEGITQRQTDQFFAGYNQVRKVRS